MTRYTKAMYERSLEYARKAHVGQKAKGGGEEYFEHVRRVSEDPSLNLKERIIACLHDTLEDTDATEEEIRREFGDKVAEAVTALTHKEKEPRRAYLERVKKNPSALKVKLADNRDNRNRPTKGLSKTTIQRLKRKYENDLRILKG